jgi:hypothetical protein
MACYHREQILSLCGVIMDVSRRLPRPREIP